ncbi:NAD-dependent epimerase/dehydratase family protein [Georgenia faecalis]|uniref:NAD-dependent epimerase/dehydratase family protein n=1 Tax=Georgenia faecalis TaxID=2483799 RepID=A0ABV9D597_9MICO|nr:NAD-dependent epimerase/dehydratase family protein [Georgenia faecalis]
MRVVVTGADGFLGWHLRARLRALTNHEVVPVGRGLWNDLPALVRDADAVIHLAGVNRGEPYAVEHGNARLALDLSNALRLSARPTQVVYANSIQSGMDSPYGRGKQEAGRVLADIARERNASFVDVLLPNIFGEGAKPNYNTFVATFVERIVQGQAVSVDDRELQLLHVQDAARVLIEALTTPGGEQRPAGTPTSVASVLQTLETLHAAYRLGEIPPLSSELEVNLLNTLRARMFAERPTIPLVRRADERGALTEAVRARGSEGQTFVSTTKPGITRGQHFHLRKLERFAVVDGEAEIAMRRLFDDPVQVFRVNGDEPVAIDMPTGWPHKITNVGSGTLTTVFWTNELFTPEDTDTYAEEV